MAGAVRSGDDGFKGFKVSGPGGSRVGLRCEAASLTALPLSWSAVELGFDNEGFRGKPSLLCHIETAAPPPPPPRRVYPRGPGGAARARRQNGRGCQEDRVSFCLSLEG